MRRTVTSLCLALVTMLLGAGMAFSQPAVDPSPPAPPIVAPSASPSVIPDTETSPTYYQAFVNGTRKLGFSPDGRLLEKVRSDIREEFVDSTTDEQLWQGVQDEVRILLKQANVSTDALDRLPVNERLPSAIADAYHGKIDNDLLWYAMVRGELSALKDPYSVLMIPDDYKHMMDGMQERTFGGIGIYIELDKTNSNALTVVEPMEGTPAWESGLQAGDAIVNIDGKPTDGMALEAAAALLRGPIGSKVHLTLTRKDVDKGGVPSREVDVTRAEIRPVSVNSKMLDKHIGYVRLRLFGEQTAMEMNTALEKLRDQGMRALILDLRNNGGGYINTAVDVCSQFVPAGSLIVSVEQRNQRPEEYHAHMVDAEARSPLPMVLLVNGYSASASEITAGCLKDLGVATLVGVKTFGKGSVQSVMRLPDGAALKLTIAHFFSPKHNIIHHVGINPDIDLPMEARLVGRDGDTQLEKAVQVLEETNHAMH